MHICAYWIKNLSNSYLNFLILWNSDSDCLKYFKIAKFVFWARVYKLGNHPTILNKKETVAQKQRVFPDATLKSGSSDSKHLEIDGSRH